MQSRSIFGHFIFIILYYIYVKNTIQCYHCKKFLAGVFFNFLMIVSEESRDNQTERNSTPSMVFARGYLSMYQRNEPCFTLLFLPTSNEAYTNHDSRSTQARLTVEQHTAVLPRRKLLRKENSRRKSTFSLHISDSIG